MKSRISGFVLLFALLSTTSAQVSTSRIEGTVIDKTNAVVADATVTVTNEETGVSYETKSSSSGTWNIPSLTPGRYTVAVSHSGFQTVSSQRNVFAVGVPL